MKTNNKSITKTFLVCTSLVLCIFVICFTICFISITKHPTETQKVIVQDSNNNIAVKYLGSTSTTLAAGFTLCFLGFLGFKIYIKRGENILQTDDSHSSNNKE